MEGFQKLEELVFKNVI